MMFPELIKRKDLHDQFPDIYCEIDHIDNVRTNNHVENLRLVKVGENACNRGVKVIMNSDIKGIYENGNGFLGRVMKDGKPY